jgi:hypothetical protein
MFAKIKEFSHVVSFAAGTVILFAIVVLLGMYIRTGGSEILLATSLAALPTGLTIVAISYRLRSADIRIQVLWCIFLMVLIRSVQLWKMGIDFHDEVGFIKTTQEYFQQGHLSGYVRDFPVNIPFVAIFEGFYSIWPNVEAFEILALFVYPLLVLGYYFMAVEISKLRGNSSTPIIPVIMFFPFIPIFCLVMTYYWPQLLGLAVMFFSCAALLHLMSDRSGRNRLWLFAVMGLSITLVFTHSISTALYLLTIIFLFIAFVDVEKRKTLLAVGSITFMTFIAAHLDTYSSTLNLVVRAIGGDIAAWQAVLQFNFPSVTSLYRVGPLVAVANTGIIVVTGALVLSRGYKFIKQEPQSVNPQAKSLKRSLTLSYKQLKSDPVTVLFFGFGLLSLVFGLFLGGSFLDPLRMLSWASLFALPAVVPTKKISSILLMVILLFLFFLLIWTVYSPWGSPFGSSPNLETNFNS